MANTEIISLTFLGTCEHRETDIHILTSFYKNISQYASKNPKLATRLFDGPGSAPMSLTSLNPIPGTYMYDPVTDQKKPVTTVISNAIANAVQVFHGTAIGDGIEHNILEAIMYVKNIIKKNKGVLPKTINLQGFSRGADTCMRLANVIYQLYPEIDINLFLIDQVPGPLRRNDPPSFTIPASVKNFEAAYMLHEFRPGFDAQDPDRYVFAAPDKTNAAIKLYYGDHGTGNRLSMKAETNHTPALLRDDLYKFCMESGSLPTGMNEHPPIALKRPRYESEIAIDPWEHNPVNDDVKYGGDKATCLLTGAEPLSPIKRFELLCGMQENEWFYSKISQRLHIREILHHRDKYINDSHLFVNQEHRELFKQLYPRTFNWIFEKGYCRLNSSGGTTTREHVIEELEKISHKPLLETFFKNLAKHAHFDIYNIEDTVASPSGIPHIEPSYFKKPAVTDKLSYLIYSLNIMVSNYKYHDPLQTAEENILAKNTLVILENAKKLTSKEAIIYIEKFIKEVNALHKKGRLYNQFGQFVSNAKKIKDIQNAIENHLKENPDLSAEKKQALDNVINKINITNQSKNHWSRDLYDDIKNEVKELKDSLAELQNFPGELKRFIFNEETSICDKIIEKLKTYESRNRFYSIIENIFFKVFKKEIHIFSKIKHTIAMELKDDLTLLKDSDKENDITTVAEKLRLTNAKLIVAYGHIPKKGTLDSIIDHGLKNIGLEYAFTINQEDNRFETDFRLFN